MGNPTPDLNRAMRPFVWVNAAMSLDGKLALPDGRQTSISGPEDLARVHRLRNENDAILVGIGTVLSDDPKLLVKKRYVDMVNHPLRVVLDTGLRTPSDAQVLVGPAPTWIVVGEGVSGERPPARIVPCGTDRIDIPKLLDILGNEGMDTLMVEGGSRVIASLVALNLVDRMTVFVGSMVIGGERSPTLAGGDGASSFEEISRFRLVDHQDMDDGILLTYEADR